MSLKKQLQQKLEESVELLEKAPMSRSKRVLEIAFSNLKVALSATGDNELDLEIFYFRR